MTRDEQRDELVKAMRRAMVGISLRRACLALDAIGAAGYCVVSQETIKDMADYSDYPLALRAMALKGNLAGPEK